MKIKLLLIALLFSVCAFSQSPTYQIEPISTDSFYLVETVSAQPTKDAPRPQTLTTYQLFRSPEQFFVFSDQFLDEANKARAEAEEKMKQAEKLEAMADKMRLLAEENKTFLGRRKKAKK